MAQAPDVQPVNISEEGHFIKMCSAMVETIIQRLVNEGISEGNIVRAIGAAIENIKDSFKSPGRGFSSIDLSPLQYGCAYVQHLGALGMGLARCKVLQALRNCEDLRNMFDKGCVNVVCLGGGPGTDVVGLTSALYECGIKSALNIIIVDSVREWSRFADLLQAFIRQPQRDMGNVSKYYNQNTVNLSFMQGRLPSQDASVIQAVRGADCILMIRFISSVEGYQNRIHVIQNARENMKIGAITIVVDYPFYKDDWSGFEPLYVEEWSPSAEAYRIAASYSGPRFGFVAAESKALLGVFRRNVEHEGTHTT